MSLENRWGQIWGAIHCTSKDCSTGRVVLEPVVQNSLLQKQREWHRCWFSRILMMASKCIQVSEKHYLDICLLRFLISKYKSHYFLNGLCSAFIFQSPLFFALCLILKPISNYLRSKYKSQSGYHRNIDVQRYTRPLHLTEGKVYGHQQSPLVQMGLCLQVLLNILSCLISPCLMDVRR